MRARTNYSKSAIWIGAFLIAALLFMIGCGGSGPSTSGDLELDKVTMKGKPVKPPPEPADPAIVYYAIGGGMMVMDADGSNVRRAAPGHGRSPAWSPDSSRLAFEGTDEPQSSRGPLPVTITIINVATGALEMILAAALGHDPAWSPDGKRIAYSHNFAIHIIDLATNEVRPLAKGVRA